MKALKCGFGLALVAGFSAMVACGGSSNDSGSTAGDSSGGNGSTTAGASSTSAGATSTTAGAETGGSSSVAGSTAEGGALTSGGASAEAGAPSGGSGGSGGTGGTGGGGNTGVGGAAMANPADCPATAPMDAAMCTPLATNQERCRYADVSCRCRGMGGGPMQGMAGGGGAATGATQWQCTTVVACPAAKPTVGDACTQGANCQYTGMGACTCGQTQKWTCFGGMMGAGGAGGPGGPGGAGGAGGAAACPVVKPTTGGACMATGPCTYGNSGCLCTQQKWVCN